MTPYQRYVQDIALVELALKLGHRGVAALPRLGGVAWQASVAGAGPREAPLAAAAALARLSGAPVAVSRRSAARTRGPRGALPQTHLWSRGAGQAQWTAWHLWLVTTVAARGAAGAPRLAPTAGGVLWQVAVDLQRHSLGPVPRLDGVEVRAGVSVAIRGVAPRHAAVVCAALALPV